jgi:hypothetical protein
MTAPAASIPHTDAHTKHRARHVLPCNKQQCSHFIFLCVRVRAASASPSSSPVLRLRQRLLRSLHPRDRSVGPSMPRTQKEGHGCKCSR